MRDFPRSARSPLAGLLASLLLAACNRDGAAPAPAVPPPAAPAAAAAAPVDAGPVALRDVIETTPGYIIGISYPARAAAYPPLARALQAYADAARGELMRAVAGLKGAAPRAPYDLSLQFSMVAETPRVVAVAADGSSYTGVPTGCRWWSASCGCRSCSRCWRPSS